MSVLFQDVPLLYGREKPQQNISLVGNEEGEEGDHDSSGLLLGINDIDEVDVTHHLRGQQMQWGFTFRI